MGGFEVLLNISKSTLASKKSTSRKFLLNLHNASDIRSAGLSHWSLRGQTMTHRVNPR
jgi:hypothetical protein